MRRTFDGIGEQEEKEMVNARGQLTERDFTLALAAVYLLQDVFTACKSEGLNAGASHRIAERIERDFWSSHFGQYAPVLGDDDNWSVIWQRLLATLVRPEDGEDSATALVLHLDRCMSPQQREYQEAEELNS